MTLTLNDSEMLLLRRSIASEARAFRVRLTEDRAKGVPSHISITEYSTKLDALCRKVGAR